LTRGVFEVLATNGDSALGGDDFDQAIAAQWRKSHGLVSADHKDLRRLLMAARRVKEQLTNDADAHAEVSLTYGQTLNVKLSRAEFHNMTTVLVERTLQPVKKAMRDTKLAVADIDGVVMVGGATRMLHVQRAVADFFGKTPLNNLDPDKVVAIGAAIQANVLAGNKSGEDMLLLDVIPLSLGLETMGGLTEKVIPRNSTIPVARVQEFTTFKDGQTAMAIHVVQGERELVKDCRSLARFTLRGFPAMVAGAARIRVTFQVDADGLVSVAAREMTSGVEASIDVKPSYGLTDAEIANMLQSSFAYAKDDAQARALAEQRVDAARLIEAVNAALVKDGDKLIDAAERSEIAASLVVLEVSALGEDHRVIKDAIAAVSKATENFAARRMDAGVAAALKGKTLDAVLGAPSSLNESHTLS
jgi:molecular chaperone HscA